MLPKSLDVCLTANSGFFKVTLEAAKYLGNFWNQNKSPKYGHTV